jgi:hypothetical protein
MNTETPIIETPIEDPPVTPTTQEDQFFGMTHTVDTSDPPEVEVVEETVKEKPVKAADTQAAQKQIGDLTDDELSAYTSKRVQERIAKITWEKHEAGRRADSAEKMQAEAINYARQVNQQNVQYEHIITTGEAYLVEQVKGRAAKAVDLAKIKHKTAYEEGDSTAIIEAQQDMINAQAEAREALNYEQDYRYRVQQGEQQRQYAGQQQQYAAQQAVQQAAQQAAQPPVRKASDEALSWADENDKWFGKRKDMTALAYGIHERLTNEQGFVPDSDEYYETLNAEMRQRFPDYDFGDAEKPVSLNAPTVVASAERNNGAKPRRVKLNARQVKLIKTLGITPEDYVRQTLSLNEGT